MVKLFQLLLRLLLLLPSATETNEGLCNVGLNRVVLHVVTTGRRVAGVAGGYNIATVTTGVIVATVASSITDNLPSSVPSNKPNNVFSNILSNIKVGRNDERGDLLVVKGLVEVAGVVDLEVELFIR